MKPIHLDETDVRTLSREIIALAVREWKTGLHSGEKKYGLLNSIPINRDDLLEFFYSDYFGLLCAMATQWSPKQIRKGLGMTQRTEKEAKAQFDICY